MARDNCWHLANGSRVSLLSLAFTRWLMMTPVSAARRRAATYPRYFIMHAAAFNKWRLLRRRHAVSCPYDDNDDGIVTAIELLLNLSACLAGLRRLPVDAAVGFRVCDLTSTILKEVVQGYHDIRWFILENWTNWKNSSIRHNYHRRLFLVWGDAHGKKAV